MEEEDEVAKLLKQKKEAEEILKTKEEETKKAANIATLKKEIAILAAQSGELQKDWELAKVQVSYENYTDIVLTKFEPMLEALRSTG